MRDRLVPGIVAGAAAGVAMDLVNAFNYYGLKFTTLRTLDWTAIIMYRHLPRVPAEAVFAEIGHLIWTALLGVVFAYVSRGWVPTQHRIVRGMVYGVTVWMLIYTVSLLFRVPFLRIIPWRTAVSNLELAIVFGVVLSYVFARLTDTTTVN